MKPPRLCGFCQMDYGRFRVGLTFAEVYRELRAEPNRRHVTRHTVLGRMHEHKRIEWRMTHGPGRCIPPEEPPCPF